MIKVLVIATGGAVGALSRYYLTFFLQVQPGYSFPVGTLAVNLIGAFIIGICTGIVHFSTMSENLRLLIMTGFLGALTTFSTYSIETVNLIKNNMLRYAILNVAISTISGILLAYAGYALIQLILEP